MSISETMVDRCRSVLTHFCLILLMFMAMMPSAYAVNDSSAGSVADMEVFVRSGCRHCEQAEQFLTRLKQEQPSLQIEIHNVSKDASALERLKTIAEFQHAIDTLRLPAFFVHGQLIIGYTDEASSGVLLRNALTNNPQPLIADSAGSCEAKASDSCEAPVDNKTGTENFSVTLLGRHIDLEDVGLPAFTLAMGLLDGFNPCSMWVLILMISMLAPMKDRSRMLAVAGTFVAVEGIAYFMFMAAWLNLFLLIGLSRTSELLIAAIAILAGAVNLKDFWAFGVGISLSIPASAKPDIYARIRRILRADNLSAAIVGAAVLAGFGANGRVSLYFRVPGFIYSHSYLATIAGFGLLRLYPFV
jgi:glutaredoxin